MPAISKHLFPVLVIATSLTGAMPARATDRAEARLAKVLEGRKAGRPVDCVSFNRIQSTEIIDGTAIIYRTGGGRIYVNRPNIGADALRDDDVMVTRTPLSQLCRLDTVQLFDRGAHFERGFVGLGAFVPYEKAAAAR
jgi:hypothetical protein